MGIYDDNITGLTHLQRYLDNFELTVRHGDRYGWTNNSVEWGIQRSDERIHTAAFLHDVSKVRSGYGSQLFNELWIGAVNFAKNVESEWHARSSLLQITTKQHVVITQLLQLTMGQFTLTSSRPTRQTVRVRSGYIDVQSRNLLTSVRSRPSPFVT